MLSQIRVLGFDPRRSALGAGATATSNSGTLTRGYFNFPPFAFVLAGVNTATDPDRLRPCFDTIRRSADSDSHRAIWTVVVNRTATVSWRISFRRNGHAHRETGP